MMNGCGDEMVGKCNAVDGSFLTENGVISDVAVGSAVVRFEGG